MSDTVLTRCNGGGADDRTRATAAAQATAAVAATANGARGDVAWTSHPIARAPIGVLRELAVLRYLPSAMSLPEIARELYVSPNTVKTQGSAIYRKLAVASRAAAVRAARELGLL